MDTSRRDARTLSTPAAEVTLDEAGVLEVRWHEGTEVGVPEIEAVLQAQQELMQGDVVVLVDAREVRTMTRAAQERTTDHPVNAGTLACAIVIGNPVSVVLGNFFMRLSRPTYPTRLFREEGRARQWLVSYLEPRAD